MIYFAHSDTQHPKNTQGQMCHGPAVPAQGMYVYFVRVSTISITACFNTVSSMICLSYEAQYIYSDTHPAILALSIQGLPMHLQRSARND